MCAASLPAFVFSAPAAEGIDGLRALSEAPARNHYQMRLNADALRMLKFGSAAPGTQVNRGYWTLNAPFLNSAALPLAFHAGGWPQMLSSQVIADPLLATPAFILSAIQTAPTALSLRAHADGQRFDLLDAAGASWLVGTHAHPSVDPQAGQLWVRNLDLRVGVELARALGRPSVEGQLIGAMNLSLNALGQPPAVQSSTSCASPQYQPRWPTLGFRADIALTHIGSVQTLRCEDCSASSSDARLALAPDARLRNVGDADIPWAPKFVNPALPPYGGDQHPFLAWNFFKVDAEERLTQIAASGFKHAFVASSLNCGCPSGFILFNTCEDVYGAFTNDIYDILSPRTELIPYRGLWARCGSIFDPDCNGVQNVPAGAPDDYTWRVTFSEAQLNIASARFFADAWYVVRDDSNIDNSMGVVEVRPTKNGALWTFPRLGAMSSGSMLERFAAQLAPTTQRLLARHQTGEGRVDTLTTVRAIPGGFRYAFYVANHEWMRTRTQGAFPNLRLLETSGIQRLDISLPSAQAAELSSADADSVIANNWLASQSDQALQFSAPSGDVGQLWGTVFRFEWTSSSSPLIGWIEASAGRGALERTVLLTALLPGGNGLDRIKQNGFDE